MRSVDPKNDSFASLDFPFLNERTSTSFGPRFGGWGIPLELSASSILRNTPLESRKSVGRLLYFTAESALATLEETGLEIIDYNLTSGEIDLYRQHPSLKTAIANVPQWLVSKFSAPLTARLFGGFIIGPDEIKLRDLHLEHS